MLIMYVPIDGASIYERSLRQVAAVIAVIQPEQSDIMTPVDNLTVKQLLVHIEELVIEMHSALQQISTVPDASMSKIVNWHEILSSTSHLFKLCRHLFAEPAFCEVEQYLLRVSADLVLHACDLVITLNLDVCIDEVLTGAIIDTTIVPNSSFAHNSADTESDVLAVSDSPYDTLLLLSGRKQYTTTANS